MNMARGGISAAPRPMWAVGSVSKLDPRPKPPRNSLPLAGEGMEGESSSNPPGGRSGATACPIPNPPPQAGEGAGPEYGAWVNPVDPVAPRRMWAGESVSKSDPRPQPLRNPRPLAGEGRAVKSPSDRPGGGRGATACFLPNLPRKREREPRLEYGPRLAPRGTSKARMAMRRRMKAVHAPDGPWLGTRVRPCRPPESALVSTVREAQAFRTTLFAARRPRLLTPSRNGPPVPIA